MFLLEKALTGGRGYRIWAGFLCALIVVGALAYIRQLNFGLGITGLSRDVAWGLYIAQFTFLIGIAASSVAVVVPYYLLRDESFGKIVLLSQSMAVAAVAAGLMFVVADMGRPARALNVLLHAAPGSIMFWDMISLFGYLLINIALSVAALRAEAAHSAPARWTVALVMISIPWAVAMRTVSALLYSGLPGRSFWLSAAMAPRALASAFAAGPALLILVCLVMGRVAGFDAGRKPLRRLALVSGLAMCVNLFLMLMELFTVFYSRIPEPLEHFTHVLAWNGGSGLQMWLSLVLSAVASAFLLIPRMRNHHGWMPAGCAMILASLWLEKSILLMGGFVPSPLGAIAAYAPTMVEIMVTLGIWAGGLLMLTIFYKITLAITGRVASIRPNAS